MSWDLYVSFNYKKIQDKKRIGIIVPSECMLTINVI
jgi:hypothetical protein